MLYLSSLLYLHYTFLKLYMFAFISTKRLWQFGRKLLQFLFAYWFLGRGAIVILHSQNCTLKLETRMPLIYNSWNQISSSVFYISTESFDQQGIVRDSFEGRNLTPVFDYSCDFTQFQIFAVNKNSFDISLFSLQVSFRNLTCSWHVSFDLGIVPITSLNFFVKFQSYPMRILTLCKTCLGNAIFDPDEKL